MDTPIRTVVFLQDQDRPIACIGCHRFYDRVVNLPLSWIRQLFFHTSHRKRFLQVSFLLADLNEHLKQELIAARFVKFGCKSVFSSPSPACHFVYGVLHHGICIAVCQIGVEGGEGGGTAQQSQYTFISEKQRTRASN